MSIVSLVRCNKCGDEGKEYDLYLRDRYSSSVRACQHCVDSIDAFLSNVRPVFDAMIAAGIDRKDANDVMTVLIDKVEDRIKLAS